MKTKPTAQSAFFHLHALIPVLLCTAAAGLMLSGTLLAFFRPEAKVCPRTLAFGERTAYQRAIEDVYWRHRIWPRERPDLKPSLNAVMSQAQLEKKVTDYLRESQVLEDYRQQPISAERLQAEMDRMAHYTRQPEVLRELFAALGNDPFVVAECLARPVLSDRLFRSAQASQQEGFKMSKLMKHHDPTEASFSGYNLPVIGTASETDGVCIDNTWTPTNTIGAPEARDRHTAVWTGSEMIVWGGYDGSGYLNTGGRYNPSTDSWTVTSITNAPDAREYPTAVWTGTEMIIWGGDVFPSYLNTGGRYDPGTDSWAATSVINAPEGRADHTPVWTGSEMIVWGGWNGSSPLNTGGRYNPVADSWTATSTTDAPSARVGHTAVWTGGDVLVWGGSASDGVTYFNSGGRYNPGTDSWTATNTTGAPSARLYHAAVWTSSEMIIWGGFAGGYPNAGGRYNPVTDTWTATSTNGEPDARYLHTAVWTGSQMIIWGGRDDYNLFNTGGRYSPVTDTWTATSTNGAPPAGAYYHTAVWTGSQMIIWGGYDGSLLNTGGRYCAQSAATATPTPSPTPTTTPRPTPTPRPRPTPVPHP